MGIKQEIRMEIKMGTGNKDGKKSGNTRRMGINKGIYTVQRES